MWPVPRALHYCCNEPTAIKVKAQAKTTLALTLNGVCRLCCAAACVCDVLLPHVVPPSSQQGEGCHITNGIHAINTRLRGGGARQGGRVGAAGAGFVGPLGKWRMYGKRNTGQRHGWNALSQGLGRHMQQSRKKYPDPSLTCSHALHTNASYLEGAIHNDSPSLVHLNLAPDSSTQQGSRTKRQAAQQLTTAGSAIREADTHADRISPFASRQHQQPEQDMHSFDRNTS
jgi:hypothetical protein